ncbi:MAG: hypothetical protein JWO30_1267 [Fibrobacteres bacterium]|nr:hypothetical protein [Fibrobacterota bacterium]
MTKPPNQALSPSGDGIPRTPDPGKALTGLASLMHDISKCRADIARRENLVSDLQRKLQTELRPMEEKIVEIRVDTFRVLGKHLKSGRLNKRAHKVLELALYDLADELEKEYGVDLRQDRNRIFEEEFPPEENDDAFEGQEDGPADPYGQDPGSYSYRESDFAGRASDKDAGAGRKEGPRSKARQKQELRDESIAGDIRALYLMLARALHPDKETDPSRLAEKTGWMQQVTAAYANRDLARLLDILAANPLDAVGPYLTQAPLKTVQGFAKRLRRELDALRTRLADLDWGMDPVLSTFIKGGKLNEAAYNTHLAAVRKDVKFLKQRRDMYSTSQGLLELVEALKTHGWRELM